MGKALRHSPIIERDDRAVMPKHPIPIHDYRRVIQTQLADAEWSGDDSSAEALRKEMARVERAIASGEMWDVPF